MITQFIKALQELDSEVTDENIADILWLTLQIRSREVIQPTQKASTNLEKDKAQKPAQKESDATRQRLSSATTSRLGQAHGDIHLPSRSGSGLKHSQKGALTFRSPAVSALPGALGLGRALRPLMRRVPSHTTYAIDEERTAQVIADQLLAGQHIALPVFQPVSQRWLEVALVIDESRSMHIWRPTIVAFKRLLERHGAFRDVRTWGLVVDTNNEMRLRPGWARTGNARLCSPTELIDPSGQRLILVVSDCVSNIWYSGSIVKMLTNWGRKGPLAIIQVLPQRLWSRSALGDEAEVQLHARSPGFPTIQLDYEPSSYLIEKAELKGRFPIPIVALKQEALQQWVQAAIMAGRAWTPGYMLDANAALPIMEEDENLTAKQRIQHFSGTASPLARTLLGLLAATPISLPVIQLIQHTMLPQSDLGHVAEVLLGGLLEQSSRKGDEYEFVEGVRDLLINAMPKSESLQVLMKVSDYIESRTGQTLDIRALLADPASMEGLVIDDASRPFARVTTKVLHKLGGEYRALAERLEEMMSSASTNDVSSEDDTGEVKHPSLFFNRNMLIEKLLSSLFSDTVQCQSIVGAAKIGKTSLVKHLSRSTTIEAFGYEGDQHLFVYINCRLHMKAVNSIEDFYRLLLHLLLAQQATRIRDLLGGSTANPDHPFAHQEAWERVLRELADKHFYLVLILDDFEQAVMQENLLRDGLFDTLRAYAASGLDNFAWITCSSRPLPILFEEAFDRYNIPRAKGTSISEFYNIVPGSHVVELFDQEDIEALITAQAAARGITFSQGERETIFRYGGRFPYFIQRACDHFFEASLKGAVNCEAILQECIKEAEDIWSGYWHRLNDQQQRLLYSIARGYPADRTTILERLKDEALVYEEDRILRPFSEEFGNFILSREYSYEGLPVNPGEYLWDHYEVIEIIGQTLHSQVVKARDIRQKQGYVAIKLPYVNQTLESRQLRQFHELLQHEAQILASLNHKNIGKIIDVSLDPLGIITPWIEGEPLDIIMLQRKPFSPARVARLGMKLADALRYTHRQGIVHRDIKPNNILMTPNDEPILIDFDMARSKDQQAITTSTSNAPTPIANREYAAPEQFKSPATVGPPADLFALGVVLYETITHQRPYPYGNDPDMYNGQLPTPEQHDIPDSLFQALRALLDQEPEQRPQAATLYDKLQAFLSLPGKTSRRFGDKMDDYITFCPSTGLFGSNSSQAEVRTAVYLYENLKVRVVGDYRILVNYSLPGPGASIQEIDIVIINKFGVFLLEVKGWQGEIEAFDDSWLINGTTQRDNPIESINRKAKILYSQMFGLRGRFNALRDVSVIGLVVLTQDILHFKNRSTFDSRAVVSLDNQLLRAISSTDLLHRGTHSQSLTDVEIQLIYQALYQAHQAERGELVENYRILKELSFGDLFNAYEAENVNVPTQHVRLKRYQLPTLSASPTLIEQEVLHFRRSVEAVFALGFHPNILSALNFFPDSKRPDVFYEVTELVTGGRLDEIMARTRRMLTLEEQLGYLEQLCAALKHAHNHREANGRKSPVYHRNICPETIYATTDNVVKLGDFDFAKYGAHTITFQGQTRIEKPFTAPEIVANPSIASAASDIYSLGVLWYFLARLPEYDFDARFSPEQAGVNIDVLNLPEAARRLMKNMVAQSPTNRPQSVEAVLNELKQLRTLDQNPAAAALQVSTKTPEVPSPVIPQNKGVDVGIIIALDEEFAELFSEIKHRYQSFPDGDTGREHYLFEQSGMHSSYQYRCVATFVGDMGPTLSSLVTHRLTERWKPRTLIMLGIAAAMGKDAYIGDVVVTKQIDSYFDNSKAVPGQDPNKFTFTFGGEVYRSNHALLNATKNFKFVHEKIFQEWQSRCQHELSQLILQEQYEQLIAQKWLRAQVQAVSGDLASGPTVGSAQAFIDWLKKRNRKYVALEMESAGFMAAIYEEAGAHQTLVLRAISDYGDERQAELDNIESSAFRRYAMRNAIKLLWSFFDAGILPRATTTNSSAISDSDD